MSPWRGARRSRPSSRTRRALIAPIGRSHPSSCHPCDIAPPCSLLEVFDPSLHCKGNYTYTIWAGVDFVIVLPDGRVLDKRLFLLELLKAHAA